MTKMGGLLVLWLGLTSSGAMANFFNFAPGDRPDYLGSDLGRNETEALRTAPLARPMEEEKPAPLMKLVFWSKDPNCLKKKKGTFFEIRCGEPKKKKLKHQKKTGHDRINKPAAIDQ